jgi:hypothetical protein
MVGGGGTITGSGILVGLYEFAVVFFPVVEFPVAMLFVSVALFH